MTGRSPSLQATRGAFATNVISETDAFSPRVGSELKKDRFDVIKQKFSLLSILRSYLLSDQRTTTAMSVPSAVRDRQADHGIFMIL
jgi:hypothetical protein